MAIIKLVGVGHVEGRLVIVEPRAEDRLSLIKRLVKLHKLPASVPTGLTDAKLKRARENRNLVAHGVWLHTPAGYAVVQTTGAWSDPELGSKKVNPAGVIVDRDGLASMLQDIETLREAAEQIREMLQAALEASPRKPA
jgi:hypothetical protein